MILTSDDGHWHLPRLPNAEYIANYVDALLVPPRLNYT